MKLKFIEQKYQTDAVNSVVNIFEGCQEKESIFTVGISNHSGLDFEGEGISYYIGHSNERM